MEIPQRHLETFQLCSVVMAEEKETTSAAFCVCCSNVFPFYPHQTLKDGAQDCVSPNIPLIL